MDTTNQPIPGQPKPQDPTMPQGPEMPETPDQMPADGTQGGETA